MRNCFGESSLRKSSRATVGGPWAATDALGSRIPGGRLTWYMHFLGFSSLWGYVLPWLVCVFVLLCSCLSTVRNRPTQEIGSDLSRLEEARYLDFLLRCGWGPESCSSFTLTLDSVPPVSLLPFPPGLFVPGPKANTLT